jgi:hypothetical protein
MYGGHVKHFVLLKLSVLLLGIGAALLFTPACRAQSEISPDHFDGTDSWAAAAAVHPPMHKLIGAKASLQAQSQKTPQGSAIQLAAAREVSKPVRQDAVAIDRKRKAAANNPQKQ